MIFSKEGFPRVTNANDFADSPVIAAWMTIVDHPQKVQMNIYEYEFGLTRYYYGNSQLENNPRCFSRDQTIMWCAGMYFQNSKSNYKPRLFAQNDIDEVTAKWKMPDVFSPSAINHLKLCNGEKGSWLGFQWLMLDIWYNGKYTPLREQNQLQAMCMVATQASAGNFVKEYVKYNPEWKTATYLYWYDNRGSIPGHQPTYNRGEPELANMIVKKIESYL